MNRIDKLIIRAKRVVRPNMELVAAIIEREGHFWIAQTHLSDGTGKHPPTVHRAPCATLEAAVRHIHTVAAEYPNSRDVSVIIDDMG